MVSSNTKGNPNHDEKGRFSSSPGGSGSSADVNNKTSAPSWLTKKNTNTKTPSWLTKGETAEVDSLFAEVKKERWWKERKVRDVQYVVDNIGEYFEDDILDEMEKAGFSSIDKNRTFFMRSAASTSHSYINEVLTNLIAKKMFHPITVVPAAQFDAEWRLAQRLQAGSYRNTPYVDTGCLTRGVRNRDERLKDALGETNNNLVLPNGMLGSCVYSAYDAHTAQSYAGSSGYVFKFLVDNKEGNTITSSNYASKRQDFINRIPEMQTKLKSYLKSKGKDDAYCDNAARMFKNTAQNDAMFPAMVMGYDVVYNETHSYSLILNYKNIKTKKDW